jgi:hypothetical protein
VETASLPPGSPGNLTLDQWIDFALKNNVDDALIYGYLSPALPANSVSRWLARIERIENAARPKGTQATVWSGRKSKLKGLAFESMMRAVFASVPSFTVWKNVATTTNEIDLLVKIGLAVQRVANYPAMGITFRL